MLTRKPIQLLAIAGLTIVMIAIVLLDINIPFVRPVLTVALILSLGYTTLLAWANHLALRGIVRALMSIMLGITLLIVSGFILNFTTWGLEARTWIFFISAIILFNSLVALLRKETVATDTNVPMTSVQNWKLDFNVGQVALIVVALVITGASIVVARNGALNQATPQYSQMWMLPDASTNASQAVLGVKNEEQQPLSYRLVVKQGDTVIQEFPSFNLAPDETWQGKVDLKTLAATDSPVEALLYRGDEQTEPYRTTKLWLQ